MAQRYEEQLITLGMKPGEIIAVMQFVERRTILATVPIEIIAATQRGVLLITLEILSVDDAQLRCSAHRYAVLGG